VVPPPGAGFVRMGGRADSLPVHLPWPSSHRNVSIPILTKYRLSVRRRRHGSGLRHHIGGCRIHGNARYCPDVSGRAQGTSRSSVRDGGGGPGKDREILKSAGHCVFDPCRVSFPGEVILFQAVSVLARRRIPLNLKSARI
jgi:hypothetical protein